MINFIVVFSEDSLAILLEFGSNLNEILISSIESDTIPDDLGNVLFEIFKAFVLCFVNFGFHGLEIHGFLYDGRVFRDV